MSRSAASWPAYLRWRDGRPRWDPGPALRAQGHRGQDLRNPDGSWMNMGDAVNAANALNAGVAKQTVALKRAPGDRSFDALLDLIEASPKFRPDAGKGKRLAKTTRINYLSHHRVIREWGGPLPVAAVKKLDIEHFYDKLAEGRGVVMANRILSSLHRVLEVAREDLEWISHNRARIERAKEEGRLVLWPAAESGIFVQCADWLGLESVGDAHILGLMTAQRRGDVLAMPELKEENQVFRIVQRKTGRTAYVPATDLLRIRLEAARQRKKDRFPGVSYSHEIVSSRTGAPYSPDGSTFTDEYRYVRAVASGLQWALDQVAPIGAAALDYAAAPFAFTPTIWDLRFQDLRDTAVTLLYEATGGDEAKVANISGHSLATVRAIIDKHYFVRNARLSQDAGSLLEEHMRRIGYAG